MDAVIRDKAILISLIKDHLVNYKLISNLNEMGLNAQAYFLDLSSVIYKLMEIEDENQVDKIHHKFMKLSQHVLLMDVTAPHNGLDDLALFIYYELTGQKNVGYSTRHH